MSVISVPPARLASSRSALPRSARALWLEFKRNGVPPADRGAWICASVVFAVGLLLFTIRGPRTRLSDNG